MRRSFVSSSMLRQDYRSDDMDRCHIDESHWEWQWLQTGFPSRAGRTSSGSEHETDGMEKLFVVGRNRLWMKLKYFFLNGNTHGHGEYTNYLKDSLHLRDNWKWFYNGRLLLLNLYGQKKWKYLSTVGIFCLLNLNDKNSEHEESRNAIFKWRESKCNHFCFYTVKRSSCDLY